MVDPVCLQSWIVYKCSTTRIGERGMAGRPWLAGAAIAVLGLCSVAAADTLVARASFAGTTIGFVAGKAYSNATLTVVGPNGYVATARSKTGLPALNLARSGAAPDGRYTYQLSAATAQADTAEIAQNNGRAKAVVARKGDAMSGSFQVIGGSIIAPLTAATASRGGRAAVDQD